MDEQFVTDLRQLKLELYRAYKETFASEFKEAVFTLLGLTQGFVKLVFDSEERAVFSVSKNPAAKWSPLWLGDVDADGNPECGILLDYLYIRHNIGHINAMAYVRDYIGREVSQ